MGRIGLFLWGLVVLMVVSGCQSVTSGMNNILPTGNKITGEVRWNFAARDGDMIVVTLSDASRVLVAQELLPTPGAKHLPIDLVVAKADLSRCNTTSPCRYSAELMRGELVKARGDASFVISGSAIIPLQTVGGTSPAPNGDPQRQLRPLSS